MSSITRQIKRVLPNGVKDSMKWAGRRVSSPARVLPDFIIPGAQKSGTTSLFRYMEQNPQICLSSEKEVHYFDKNYSRGLNWYKAHFPLRTKADGDVVTGEASPYYLYHPLCPERIHAIVPDAKLIILLRNPTARAISHYYHIRRAGRDPLSLPEAMHAEEDRVFPEEEMLMRDGSYNSFSHQHHSYKQRGIYIRQLERYWKYFSRESMLIMSSDRFFRDTRAALREIFSFLDVGTEVVDTIDLASRNRGSNKEPVPESVTAYLDDYFRPYNQELVDVLGDEFRDWL